MHVLPPFILPSSNAWEEYHSRYGVACKVGWQSKRQTGSPEAVSGLVFLPPPESGSNDMYTCQMEPRDQGQGTPHRIKVIHRGMWLNATTPDLVGLPLEFRGTGLITRHQGSVVAFSANVGTQI